MIACVGIISDTHGVLPAEALDVFSGNYTREMLEERRFIDIDAPATARSDAALDPAPRKCDLIVHAGDIGASLVVDELETVAPVIAVLGNCDRFRYFTSRGEARDYEVFSEAGATMAVLHRPEDLRAALYGAGTLRPPFITSNPRIAIHGHTHFPKIEVRALTAATADKSPGGHERPAPAEGESARDATAPKQSPLTRLTLCPGSATRPREGNHKTVMVLYLDEGAVLCVDLVALD